MILILVKFLIGICGCKQLRKLESMNQIQYFQLVTSPLGRHIRFMIVETIVRKTGRLKRHCGKNVKVRDSNPPDGRRASLLLTHVKRKRPLFLWH